MATGSFYPAVEGDDGYVDNGSFNNTNGEISFGSGNRNAWVRFANVTIPQGSTITSAVLKLSGYFYEGSYNAQDTVNGKICFGDADNPSAPTNTSEVTSASRTSYVNWSAIGHWSNETQYDSPDLKTSLQTVVDRAGFASGNAIMCYIDDNSSDSSKYRIAEKYNGTYPAELYVEWTEPGVGVFYPAVSGDDGYISYGTTFNNNATFSFFSTAYASFIRFPNVTIPAGATITSAFLRYTSVYAGSGAPYPTSFYFEDADDPDAPTTYGEFDDRVRTSAVSGNEWPSPYSADTAYDSDDLSAILQEVIDRPGWASGNAVLFISDPVPTYGSMRFYTYDNGSMYPELHVEWTVSIEGVVSESFSVGEQISDNCYYNDISDSFSVGELISDNCYYNDISDSFGVSEGLAGSDFFSDSVSESFSFDDAPGATCIYPRSTDESFSLHEQTAPGPEEELLESFSLQDTAATNEFYFGNNVDTFSMDDLAELSGHTYQDVISESFALDEEFFDEIPVLGNLSEIWPLLTATGEVTVSENFGAGELTLLEAEGYTGPVGVGELPNMTCSGEARVGAVAAGAIDLSLFAMTGVGYCGATLDQNLFTPYTWETNASAITGELCTLEQTLGSLEISAHANVEQYGWLDENLPRLRVTSSVIHDVNASLAKNLPKWTLSAKAYTGDLGSFSEDLPAFRIDAHGYESGGAASVVQELPMLWCVASAHGGAPGFYAVAAMNVRKGAVTEWSLGFNSVAFFNGKTIATDGTKIYEITGTTDDVATPNAEITCNIKTGNLDLANWQQMRLTDSYANIKADGDLLFSFELDEHAIYEVAMEMHDLVDTHEEKVNLGKGMKARVYAVSLYNVDGSHFKLNRLQFIGQILD